MQKNIPLVDIAKHDDSQLVSDILEIDYKVLTTMKSNIFQLFTTKKSLEDERMMLASMKEEK